MAGPRIFSRANKIPSANFSIDFFMFHPIVANRALILGDLLPPRSHTASLGSRWPCSSSGSFYCVLLAFFLRLGCVPLLVRDTYNGTHPKRREKADSSKRELKTIAGRSVREPERKLPNGACATELEIFKKVLARQKNGKNKTYTLHEPEAYRTGKGKAHKKYKYGCKASVALAQKTGITVGAMTFSTNVYDGHTLEDVLTRTQELTGRTPKTATVDRSYKGKQTLGGTRINIPKPPLKKENDYQKRKKRKHFRRRAAIGPIIGHLKSDHRRQEIFSKGKLAIASIL